jgi:hypothetical protein
MHRRDFRLLIALMCLCFAGAFAKPAWAAEEKAEAKKNDSKFLRFIDDNDGGGRSRRPSPPMKKAALRSTWSRPCTWARRNTTTTWAKTFQGYDSLLYEMVKPKDAPVPGAGARSESMVSAFQRMLKEFLELEFQLDAIDYTAKNFVHADLDAETFEKMQAERGENIFTLMLRQMLDEMSKPQQRPRSPCPS